jgi:uncharacterized protein YkwD
MRLLAGSCLGIAVLTAGGGASLARSTGCRDANVPVIHLSVRAAQAAVACLINRERIAHGLPALRVSGKLDRVAEGWSRAMVASHQLGHGTNFTGRLNAVGYDWQMAGENVATGQRSPAAVVKGWMASVGHCENILNPEFRDLGSGETPAPVRGVTSSPATWTEDFGLTMSASPASRNMAPYRGCPYR